MARVAAFAASLAHGSWFAVCGEPLTERERADANLHVAALSLPAVAVEGVAGWTAAAAVTQRPDWSRAWWDAEAAAQAALRMAAGRHGEAPFLAALGLVTEAAGALHDAAALAASRAGIADEALTRVAAGAAAQACHQAALALAAEAGPEHAFAIKLRLFAAGRWPLGVVGGRCFVF